MTPRSTYILHRAPKAKLPYADRGEGCYLFDKNGKAYLDGSGGAAVSCLGHSHPAVIEAIKAQIDRFAFAHTGFFTNDSAEALAKHLVERTPDEMGEGAVYFVSGGSEANETAMKLARHYHLEKGEPKRHRFIARFQSYHGNTLGALAVGGNKARRAPYQPLLVETSHIEPCYAYRHQRPDESEEDYGLRAANALEAEILRLGPENVAGFLAETVGGATPGVIPPVKGYFKRVREICDKYGVLLMLDEVMCGMGRTGTLYACEQDDVAPDILTCAKGLGGGYQPIGAVVMTEKVINSILEGSGAFEHGFTYIGHPTATAAALAVQRTIDNENLLSRVQEKGKRLKQALTERFGQHPAVGDIRGRGLFIGVE
ncbi:MAG: aspartate aminotransferase family protein, partial [Kiloniellales bacterium]|nr:aspartate aminotransferase family protein [Kiloniellales bacterium]